MSRNTPSNAVGLALDEQDETTPRFWRCLLCSVATSDLAAIVAHTAETGHGYVADNAYAETLEALQTQSDRLTRLMALVYEGPDTQRRLEAMNAGQLTTYLDDLRAYANRERDDPPAEPAEPPAGFRSATVSAAPEVGDNWDPKTEEGLLLQVAPLLKGIADDVRSQLPPDFDFGVIVLVPPTEPGTLGRILATTSNRQRVAIGAAQWAMNAMEHPE